MRLLIVAPLLSLTVATEVSLLVPTCLALVEDPGRRQIAVAQLHREDIDLGGGVGKVA
jgi:hypothetical protein